VDTRSRSFTALVAGSALLAACGISIGFGPNDDPPNVSLAAAPQQAAPGERIGLVAAASDDYAVREVQFYRIDVGGNTLLGSDGSAPYALETTLPAGVRGEVRYFARAIDDAGQEAESQVVAVTVQ
jgi:hypothetical protein